MNIYLKLFLLFFKIGIFTFGGGHAMIPMISEEVEKNNFLTETELTQLIAISESTPGPFGINIATFIGSSQAGILGAIMATIGVILPSFIIILLIASIFTTFSKNKYVKKVLANINPIIIGLILSAGLYILFQNVITVSTTTIVFDYMQIILFAGLMTLYYLTKEKIHPIILIVTAGIFGIVIYQFYSPIVISI